MIRITTKRFFAFLFAMILLTGAMPRGYAQETAPAAASSAQTADAGGRASTPEEESPERKQQIEDEGYRHSGVVTTIGHAVGLSPEQAATAFTLINLAVLVGFVGWFLAKSLPKTFRDRNTQIQKHLVDARTATEEASARLNSVEERLSKLGDQIAGMRAQAEKDSAMDEQRIKASVEDEKNKILAAAEQEIAAATTHAHRQIQQYAAELAIEQAARKLSISAETDRLLVQNFARRLSGDESKEGQN